jgi:predicted Zn-dependent protease
MPWNMQPVALRQQILMKLDKAAMAEERARKLIAQFPDNAQLRSMLVQALEAQGKRKEAQEILQKG